MALPKPQASKAPAPTSDYSGADYTGLNTGPQYQVGAKFQAFDQSDIPTPVGITDGRIVDVSHDDNFSFSGQQRPDYAIVQPPAH